MPLIAQDYWVSNLFGNTMYLLALSYYFVITFLGYNGKPVHATSSFAIGADVPSTAIPQPHRRPTRANTSPGRDMAHQPLHLRLRDKFGAGAVVRRESAETCLIRIDGERVAQNNSRNLSLCINKCYWRSSASAFV